MKRIISVLILLPLLLSACTSPPEITETAIITETELTTETEIITETVTEEETEEEKSEVKSMQLIPDLEFKTGMRLITQKDHKNNDSFRVFQTHAFYDEKVKESTARWGLAQWDSGTDLSQCLIESNKSTVTDGKYRTFSYDADENMMTFYLDTSAYYQGSPAVQGDYWPHLLIEQEDFRYKELDKPTREYYKCRCKSIILSLDIKLGDYSETAVDGDWVRAAQFLLYFYVKGINSNDFCWFGIQFFDNRYDKGDHYIGYDGGKADASGAMIYLIGSKYAYPGESLWKDGAPQPNGEWRHIEIDLKPYLEDMLQKGLEDGYFKVKTLDKLCLNGMNMGWETIGTFSHTMYVKNLSLVSYTE